MPAGMISRCIFLRPVLACVRHEAEVALPESARLAVGGGDAIGVAAIGNRFDQSGGLKTFQIGVKAAAAHHIAHAFHLTLCGRGGCGSGPRSLLEERQQVGAAGTDERISDRSGRTQIA